MADEFTAPGYVAEAKVKAKEQDGVVTRTLELKVLIPEPGGEQGKAAFRATVRDAAALVGERLVLHGAAEQVLLPLGDR